MDARYRKYVVVIGCMFLLLAGGLDSYWGSMSIYVLSYVMCRQHPDSWIEMPVTISVFYISYILGMIISGFWAKRVGRFMVIVGATTLWNVSTLSSYFAIQRSFLAFNAMFALLPGFCVGLIYGVSLEMIVDAARGKNVGLLTSLLICSTSLGAFGTTQVVTWYTNPQNKSPEWALSSSFKYFTTKDVIDKVPSMFLVIGSTTLIWHIIGCTLLCLSKDFPIGKYYDKKQDECKNETASLKSNACCQDSPFIRSDTKNSIVTPTCLNLNLNQKEDYTPEEMIKTGPFYALCISYIATDFSYLIVYNYYKLYGQIWIHDDHFLSDTGTITVLGTAFLKVVNGYILDRFGIKTCLVSFIALSALIISFLYFSVMVNRWLYFIMAVSCACLAGAAYCSYFSATTLLFGKTYATTNLGIMMALSVVLNIAAPFLFDAILNQFGWFVLFIGAAFVNALSLSLCVCVLPS